MKEIWKDVVGYEGFYEVSNLGRIKRVEHYDSKNHRYCERILSLNPQKNGYVRVHLSKNGIAEWESLHRIVATAFVEKKDGCDIVNHLDNNPSNNKAENLEWTTYKGNMEYAAIQGRMKYKPENLKKAQESNKKAVIATNGDVTHYFSSQVEAANFLGVNSCHISAACRKEYGYKKVGGYEWTYTDKEYQKKVKPNKVKMSEEEYSEFLRKRMIGNKIMLGKKLSEKTKEKLRKSQTKEVVQFQKNGEFVAEYYSTQEAKRCTGISHIDDCCRGDRNTAGGYIWRYKNE